MDFKRPELLLCLLLTAVCTSGCAPIFSALFGGESARAAKLMPAVDKVHREVYWTNYDAALLMVEPDKRTEISQKWRDLRSGQRLVAVKLGKVTFEDNAYTAKVEAMFRFVGSSLVVRERTERETWKFYPFQDQWLLSDAEPVTDPSGTVVTGEFIAGPMH